MRKITVIIALFLAAIQIVSAQKVGLVLSGGGAKGAAHIGVIKALEENNIPIDYITGTSIGAIIGSLYAMGYSPEEMLEHPANDLVRTFMGKHTPDTAPSKVESFMRTNVFSVRKDRGVLECAERMARGSVDTLLVTDEQNRYLGTISIGDIRHWGRELTSIEPLIRQTARTVRVGDEAKESFDYLLDSGANYVVVLNADDTIAGIVTKTSVARSVAENLWGDSK
mgnify:CR=1 FL=1